MIVRYRVRKWRKAVWWPPRKEWRSFWGRRAMFVILEEIGFAQFSLN